MSVSLPIREHYADLLHGKWNGSIGDTLILAETVRPSFLIDTTKKSIILREVRNQPPCGESTQKSDEAFKDKTVEKEKKGQELNINIE